MGREVASSFTEVGLTRVSIGPAISVRLRGRAGSRSSAISAAAASTGTAGWQTATTCAPGPIARRKPAICATKPSKPKEPALTGTSRALCQSVICTS